MNDFRLTLRFVGLAFGLMVGLTFGNVLSLLNDSKDTRTAIFALGIAIGGFGYLLGPHLSWRLIRDTKRRIAEASSLDLVAVGIGLGFGAIVAAPLALPLSFLPDPAGRFLPLVVAVAACTLSTAVVVDGGRPLVGKQASVTVTRMLQTGVGRMVFATPKHANP